MRIDFHVHTWKSKDANIRAMHIQKNQLVEGFVITDHDSVDGFLELKNNIDNKILIPGCEISTDRGDILAIFYYEDEIPKGTYYEVLDQLRSVDCLIALPHPTRGHTNMNELLKDFKIIESFNGHSSNKENLKVKNCVPAEDHIFIAGSDAHYPFQLGKYYTVVPEAEDPEEIRKQIEANNIHIPDFTIGPLYRFFTLAGNFFSNPNPDKIKKISRINRYF